MVRHSEKHLIIILHPSSLSLSNHLNVKYCFNKSHQKEVGIVPRGFVSSMFKVRVWVRVRG